MKEISPIESGRSGRGRLNFYKRLEFFKRLEFYKRLDLKKLQFNKTAQATLVLSTPGIILGLCLLQ